MAAETNTSVKMTGEKSSQNLIVCKTYQGKADRVNESLPIRLTAQVVEKHPQLMNLLTSLSQHLNSDGGSKITSSEMQQAEAGMQNDKLRWLQNQVLYQELQDLLMDHQLTEAQNKELQPAAKQFYRSVQECLSLAELGDYLDCSPDPSSTVTLLGLQKEDLKEMNPYRKHLSSIQQKLIPEIEERLRKKCEMLVEYYDCTTAQKTENKFALAKASQLPEIVESEKRKLSEQKKKLEREKYNREKQFWACFKALIESLETLEKLITRHRLSSQKESNSVSGDWLSVRCQAMALKIKVFEVQLLCETYHAQTVEALNVISHHLNTAIAETEDHLSRVTQALRAYESVGMGFENIVREYTDLRDEIENKKWAMRELKLNLDG